MTRRTAAAKAARSAEADDVQDDAVDQEDEEDEAVDEAADDLPKLQFNEPLSWRVGQGIPIADLLRRLEALATELKSLPQGDIDKASLVPVAKELVQQNLLTHKDKGVKALAACCLVDMLAICVPDAPFTPQQMQDIFNLVISHSIPSLQDSANPYYNRHLHVLHSLSEVKSIVLLADVPRPDSLVRTLFQTCFDILANPSESQAKHLEYNITGLLQSFIEESPKLPSEVVEIILTQFLRANRTVDSALSRSGKRQDPSSTHKELTQSHLNFKQLPPAYHVAKNLCSSCAQQLARPISQYFNQIIVDSATSESKDRALAKPKPKSRTSTRPEQSEDAVASQELLQADLQELEKAHGLLKEIWRCAPHVLSGVIPQVEAELSRDHIMIRLVATDAIGDMISGIGAASSVESPLPDPAAYPPLDLSHARMENSQPSQSNAPSSALSFAQTHPSAYHHFLGRRNDKAPEIRAAWSKKIGCILSTSAGGLGIGAKEETEMANSLAQLLVDSDERVRIATIQALSYLDFQDFLAKLGPTGDSSSPASVLYNLTDRVRDRKHLVRTEATNLLATLWGVGYGEILAESEPVTNLLAPVPSKIFSALYANDTDINALIDQVLFELLLPLEYPRIKKKPHPANSRSSRSTDQTTPDPDMLRAQRLLVMYSGLDQRAKTVLLALMGRPAQLSPYMKAFLKRCEDYNGGVTQKNGQDVKQHLGRLIDFFAKLLPDHSRATEDLWKFAKLHDRRCYGLIRFCMTDESDYNRVYKSIRELTRRLEDAGAGTQTVRLLVLRCSNIFYNRSHIHPIVEFSRNDQSRLAPAAHELLKDISAKSPGLFKAHAKELCTFLEESAPSQTRPCDHGSLDALKACSSFAARYPQEITNERKFMQALLQYAIYGTPASTAKYAVSVLLSSTDKKDMYASDLVQKCVVDFVYGSDHFLAQLASLSQVMLYSSSLLDESKDVDPIMSIAIEQILMQKRASVDDAGADWEDEVDQECEAKMWALKIIVNRLRSYDKAESVQEISKPLYKLLHELVSNYGGLNAMTSLRPAHNSRLRLQAALLLLKLSCHKDFDLLLAPESLNALSLLAQDPILAVREKFINKIKKYLGQDRLPSRFYSIVFLQAFEPIRKLQRDTQTWLKARAITLAKAKKATMEQTLARFLSLLAHHPDFDDEALERKVKYMVFYLEAVATNDNLSLLYHVVQRVKTVQDANNAEISNNLYYLSDLAAAVITQYGSIQNWSLESYAGKVRLPTSLFTSMPSQEIAHQVATKQYLSDDEAEQVESLVRYIIRAKKRKQPDEQVGTPAKKRQRASDLDGQSSPVTSAPASASVSRSKQEASTRRDRNAKATPKQAKKKAELVDLSSTMVERRKSSRATRQKSYAEAAVSDDNVEMGDAQPEEHEAEPHEEAHEAQAEQATPEKAKAKPTAKSPVSQPKEARATRSRLRARG